MDNKKSRILLADDHAVVRKGLAALINDEPRFQVIAQAENGSEAVALYLKHHPDLVILDIQMPLMGGVAATEQILKEDPSAKVILFTTYDGDEDIYRGLNAGAKAYLLKDATTEDIFRAIDKVLSGGRYIPTEVAEKLYSRVSGNQLTEREQEVLRFVGMGLKNRDISVKMKISENTVKTHLSSITEKLGASSRTDVALIATKRGLLRV